MTQRALASNHFAFIAAHRGRVRHKPTFVDVVGDVDALSSWTPLGPDVPLPDEVTNVRLFPWSGAGWHERLAAQGFQLTETLVYMETPAKPLARPLADLFEVSTVADDEAAAEFASVQAAAFLDQDNPADDWWRSALRAAAVRNHTDPRQTFYLLHVAGRPTSVALTVNSDDVCGIYAVATVPDSRGRGFAGALLDRIRYDCVSHGGTRLALQVVAGSDAERLYRKAGFTETFRSSSYRRC